MYQNVYATLLSYAILSCDIYICTRLLNSPGTFCNMDSQTQQLQPVKPQKGKHAHWVRWTVVSLILTAVFAVVVFLILRYVGIQQGVTLLTIISIIAGIVFGSLGFTLSLLQYYYPRTSDQPISSVATSLSSDKTMPNEPSFASQPSQQPSSPSLLRNNTFMSSNQTSTNALLSAVSQHLLRQNGNKRTAYPTDMNFRELFNKKVYILPRFLFAYETDAISFEMNQLLDRIDIG
jgi:hypothetical protein